MTTIHAIHLEGLKRPLKPARLRALADVLTRLVDASGPLTCGELGIGRIPRLLVDLSLIERADSTVWSDGHVRGWIACPDAHEVLKTWLDTLDELEV